MKLRFPREIMTQFRENGFSDEIKATFKNFRFDKKCAQASALVGCLVVLTAFGTVNGNDTVAADNKAAVQEATVNEVATEEVDSEWANKLMADVDESLAVRETADQNSAVVGKLRKGDVADVVESLDGWYHITSGSVDGYVKAEYCKVGDEAKALSQEDCTTYATATTGGLRVRSSADENASIVTVMSQGGKLAVSKDAASVDGWVAVLSNNKLGYVKSDYVTVATAYGSAISAAEEAAAKEAAAKAAAAKASAQTTATTTTQNAAVAASVDDVTLLAALIQHEAGSGSYDGKVAVGAVVMNRVRSGSYPSSVSGVINQRGQFGRGTAGLTSILNNGPSASCVQAAQEAINGVDNTGGAVQFRSARSGHAGTVIGGNVFW